MRLQTDNLRLGTSLESMQRALQQVLPVIANQVNAVSEGRIQGSHNAADAPPVIGTSMAGDYVKNKAPAVLGTAGSRYVIKGWVCVAGGEPGTWVQDRGLTGT